MDFFFSLLFIIAVIVFAKKNVVKSMSRASQSEQLKRRRASARRVQRMRRTVLEKLGGSSPQVDLDPPPVRQEVEPWSLANAIGSMPGSEVVGDSELEGYEQVDDLSGWSEGSEAEFVPVSEPGDIQQLIETFEDSSSSLSLETPAPSSPAGEVPAGSIPPVPRDLEAAALAASLPLASALPGSAPPASETKEHEGLEEVAEREPPASSGEPAAAPPAAQRPGARELESSTPQELAIELFGSGTLGFESKRRFEEHYRGRLVRWQGEVDRHESYSNDSILGAGPGVRLTAKVECELSSITRDVRIVIALPDSFSSSEKLVRGTPISFEGRLHDCNPYMLTFYLLDGAF